MKEQQKIKISKKMCVTVVCVLAGLEDYVMDSSLQYLQDDFSNPKGKLNLNTVWKNGDNEISIWVEEYEAKADIETFTPEDFTAERLYDIITSSEWFNMVAGNRGWWAYE